MSAAPKGNGRARVGQDLACVGTLAPVGSEVGEHFARGRSSSGLPVLVVIKSTHLLPATSAKDGLKEEKKQTPGAAAGELVNKSAPDASPCPRRTSGSWGRRRWEGEALRGWGGWAGREGGAANAGSRDGAGARNVSLRAPPGLTRALEARAHPPDLPRPQGGGGEGEGAAAVLAQGQGGRRRRPACHRRPRRAGSPRPPTAPAAGRLPMQPAARPARPRHGPVGQVPRSLGP